jgi:hypothetical protein
VKDPMLGSSYPASAHVNVSLGVEQPLVRLEDTGSDSKASVRLSLVAFRAARLIRSCTSSGLHQDAACFGQSAIKFDIGWQV